MELKYILLVVLWFLIGIYDAIIWDRRERWLFQKNYIRSWIYMLFHMLTGPIGFLATLGVALSAPLIYKWHKEIFNPFIPLSKITKPIYIWGEDENL